MLVVSITIADCNAARTIFAGALRDGFDGHRGREWSKLMSAGRPTDYCEEYAGRVLTFCGEGYSLTAFAGEIGVCRATINNWCAEFPEFLEAVSRAKAARALWWEDRAREVAQKGGPGGQATMVIFGLKNHAPDDFKEVTRQEHTGKNGGPIDTQSLTPEQRAEQAVRLVDEMFGADAGTRRC